MEYIYTFMNYITYSKKENGRNIQLIIMILFLIYFLIWAIKISFMFLIYYCWNEVPYGALGGWESLEKNRNTEKCNNEKRNISVSRFGKRDDRTASSKLSYYPNLT